MIRLIASDMDGTLLDEQKRLPPRFEGVVRRLRAQGVRFAVASGRQYETLLRDFPRLADELIFIAENGAMAADGRRLLFVDSVPPEQAARALRAMHALQGVYPILCTAHGAFIEDADEAFEAKARMYYARVERVPDLIPLCAQGEVCKIAAYDPQGAEGRSFDALRGALPELSVILSAATWSDVMRPGVSKGSAMRALQRSLGIGPEECMAFGDYLNDLELLQACGHSYAMRNAHPRLKAAARFEAPGNDENGVMRVLREAFDLEAEFGPAH